MSAPRAAAGPSTSEAAAARARRYRDRKRRSAFVVPIETDDALLGVLIAAGLLDGREARRRSAVEAALQKWIRANAQPKPDHA